MVPEGLEDETGYIRIVIGSIGLDSNQGSVELDCYCPLLFCPANVCFNQRPATSSPSVHFNPYAPCHSPFPSIVTMPFVLGLILEG